MPTPVADFLGPRSRRRSNFPKELGICLFNDISFFIKTFVLMLVMANLENIAGAPSENAQKQAQINKVDDRHAKVDCRVVVTQLF